MAFYGRQIVHHPSTASYWAGESFFSDTSVVEDSTVGASRVTLKWSRTVPSGFVEDQAMTTLTLAMNMGPGDYQVLNNAAKADAESDLGSFWDNIKTLITPAWTLVEYAWHDWSAPETKLGPADRVTTLSAAAAGTGGRIPDQNAITVTFRTASREHWGRSYLGGFTVGQYDATYGRPSHATCDALATHFNTLQGALQANTQATEIVVHSLEHQAVLSVDEIHCDDVPDIIRSRRPRRPTYRKVFS